MTITPALTATPVVAACWVEYRGRHATFTDMRGKAIRAGEKGLMSLEHVQRLSDEDRSRFRRVKGPEGNVTCRFCVANVSPDDAKVEEKAKRARLSELNNVKFREAYQIIADCDDIEKLEDYEQYEKRPGVRKRIRLRMKELEAAQTAGR